MRKHILTLGIFRLKDNWVFATPGEFAPGFQKPVEPVHVLPARDTEKMFPIIFSWADGECPKTTPPEKNAVAPHALKMGYSDYRAFQKASYEWTIRFKPDSPTLVRLFEKTKKQPVLERECNSYQEIREVLLSWTTYKF